MEKKYIAINLKDRVVVDDDNIADVKEIIDDFITKNIKIQNWHICVH